MSQTSKHNSQLCTAIEKQRCEAAIRYHARKFAHEIFCPTPHVVNCKNSCIFQKCLHYLLFFLSRAKDTLFSRCIGHTRHTTFGRTPLDEGSARRRDHYLTTYNIQNRRKSMLPARFEPAVPISEWPQTLALDRSATGIGCICCN